MPKDRLPSSSLLKEMACRDVRARGRAGAAASGCLARRDTAHLGSAGTRTPEVLGTQPPDAAVTRPAVSAAC